jgi:splicing factor 45
LLSIASLRFQPIRRPQQSAAAAKAKAKAIANKLSAAPTPSVPQALPQEPPQPAPPKTTIDDWTATPDEDEWFETGKRQRGGRKKRKKNKQVAVVEQNWDDIYDPSRPTNYEEYKHSEEKILEVREWKDLLYRHRMRRRDSSEEGGAQINPPMNSTNAFQVVASLLTVTGQFAPPMSFAPPSNLNDDPPPPPPVDIPDDSTGEDAYARRMRLGQQPPPPSGAIPENASGEDAWARRMRISQTQEPPLPPAEPAPQAGHISRAPVRYNLPEAPSDIPLSEAELEEKLEAESTEEEQQRSSRPGQAGFAERLMAKYGWSKGQGLGAKGTGIVNPLYAKADVRKKKSDAEGGGFATPAGTGKILGGRKAKGAAEEEQGKFGAMSEVIRLEHMLVGMDVDEELSRGEGGIMQEIGEECGDKYGTVERVYIHRRSAQEGGPLVFVCFVSQLSALRAVNALDGRVFGGNAITARFWDKERFSRDDFG